MRPSSTRNGPGEWADHNAPDRRDLVGRIRRMAISLTSKALWQVLGHVLPDGRTETRTADVFSGNGLYSRPGSSDRPEAIVLFPGGAGHPVIVASRNEDARKRVEAALGALAEGATWLYSGAAVVHVTASGQIELRSFVGVVQPTLLGTTYRTAEDTLMTAIVTALTALQTAAPTLTGTAPQQTAYATAMTALTTAKTAFDAGAASYLTTVVKVQ